MIHAYVIGYVILLSTCALSQGSDVNMAVDYVVIRSYAHVMVVSVLMTSTYT